jgi:hypothetical protein
MMLDDGPVLYLVISVSETLVVLSCCRKYRLNHAQPQLVPPVLYPFEYGEIFLVFMLLGLG